jgi:hypothetical protein
MVCAWFSARSLCCAVCRAARQAGDIDLTARARVRWGLSSQAAMWHPDKNAHTVELASRKFNEVKIALDILSDETLRRQYDLKQFKSVLGYRSVRPTAPRRRPLLARPACSALPLRAAQRHCRAALALECSQASSMLTCLQHVCRDRRASGEALRGNMHTCIQASSMLTADMPASVPLLSPSCLRRHPQKPPARDPRRVLKGRERQRRG